MQQWNADCRLNAENIIRQSVYSSEISLMFCRPSLISIFATIYIEIKTGVQFEGDLGEIVALGAEISPYIGLREKWESP